MRKAGWSCSVRIEESSRANSSASALAVRCCTSVWTRYAAKSRVTLARWLRSSVTSCRRSLPAASASSWAVRSNVLCISPLRCSHSPTLEARPCASWRSDRSCDNSARKCSMSRSRGSSATMCAEETPAAGATKVGTGVQMCEARSRSISAEFCSSMSDSVFTVRTGAVPFALPRSSHCAMGS